MILILHDVYTAVAKSKRRIEVATGTPGIGNSFIDIAFDKGQVVNVHGFRMEQIIEPQDADANANGIVAIYVLPGGVIANSDLPVSFGNFGDEDTAPYLWGIMPWAASNQTPAKNIFTPKTTRNIQAGGRIVVNLRTEGISAGIVRQSTVITCFTTPVS